MASFTLNPNFILNLSDVDALQFFITVDVNTSCKNALFGSFSLSKFWVVFSCNNR